MNQGTRSNYVIEDYINVGIQTIPGSPKVTWVPVHLNFDHQTIEAFVKEAKQLEDEKNDCVERELVRLLVVIQQERKSFLVE